MKALPIPETYEDGLKYWPYRKSLAAVREHVVDHAPMNATVLDVMCGPGYLLGQIAKRRSDLSLAGVDIDERYVPYGRATYPGVSFEQGDVLAWKPESTFDVVLCTGSLHHIPYAKQEDAIAAIAAMVRSSGFAIISDCYVDDFEGEIERKLAAAKLGHEYLVETIRNGAPDKVVEWTVDILWNDVLEHEYKTSVEKRLLQLKKHFTDVLTSRIWPSHSADTGYGDYVHICTPGNWD